MAAPVAPRLLCAAAAVACARAAAGGRGFLGGRALADAGAACTAEKGVDYHNGFFLEKEAEVDDCSSLCLSTEECTHFTVKHDQWVTMCYLKSGPPKARTASAEGFVSGVCSRGAADDAGGGGGGEARDPSKPRTPEQKEIADKLKAVDKYMDKQKQPVPGRGSEPFFPRRFSSLVPPLPGTAAGSQLAAAALCAAAAAAAVTLRVRRRREGLSWGAAPEL